MIRGVLQDGVIYPTEPVPSRWHNGLEVQVEEAESGPPESSDNFDEWYREMQDLTAELDDPAEWQRLEAALAEADTEAKGMVRREMGLT